MCMIVDDGKSSGNYNFQLLYYFVVMCNIVFLFDKHMLEIGTRFIFIVFFPPHPKLL
jgi:hypothetical protein